MVCLGSLYRLDPETAHMLRPWMVLKETDKRSGFYGGQVPHHVYLQRRHLSNRHKTGANITNTRWSPARRIRRPYVPCPRAHHLVLYHSDTIQSISQTKNKTIRRLMNHADVRVISSLDASVSSKLHFSHKGLPLRHPILTMNVDQSPSRGQGRWLPPQTG